MKLYELKPNSHFILRERPMQPPGDDHIPVGGNEYVLRRIDGAYSQCVDTEGNICFFGASTMVQEV